MAWCQSPHLGPVALGEMPGWVLGLKVPVSRLGLLGLQSLLAQGSFAAMHYQVQELGALSVGPLEGCPAMLEPNSVSQRIDSRSNLAHGKAGKKD